MPKDISLVIVTIAKMVKIAQKNKKLRLQQLNQLLKLLKLNQSVEKELQKNKICYAN
jgi:hypothetical protein